MERNENGLPVVGREVGREVGRRPRAQDAACAASGGPADGNGGCEGGGGTNGGAANGGCRDDNCSPNTALDGMMPAYVYAPSQRFCMLYADSEALAHGTLFEELYKPLGVYGREH